MFYASQTQVSVGYRYGERQIQVCRRHGYTPFILKVFTYIWRVISLYPCLNMSSTRVCLRNGYTQFLLMFLNMGHMNKNVHTWTVRGNNLCFDNERTLLI